MSATVSIIIPCYNAARWIAASLDSALGQTWSDKEIIVVDDGSTDNSLALARKSEPHGVRVVTQSNAGQCAACNHGLRLARGEYIKFLDADDLLSPESISLQVDALAAKPGYLAYGEWARFHADPAEAVFTLRPGWHDAAPADWLTEIWADAQPMMQCGQFLIPHELLCRKGGWDERLTLINDFEFFSRLVTASQGIIFTPGARLFYRSGLPGSLSRSRSAQAWKSAFLSTALGTGHLLALENSQRTRRATATILQGLVHDMYPNMPELVMQLEARVEELGGSTIEPLGGKGFQLARKLLGWKTTRWLQLLAGKYPRPLTR